MVARFSRRVRLAGVVLAGLAAGQSARADYTWLGNDTTFGGDGVWDNATTPSWSTDGVSTTPVVWSPNNIAAFPTPAGTVTVNGNVDGVQGLKFNAPYPVPPGTAPASLTFPTTASQQYTIDNASAVTIGAV